MKIEEIKELLKDIQYKVDVFEDKIEINRKVSDFLSELSLDDRLPKDIQEKADDLFWEI